MHSLEDETTANDKSDRLKIVRQTLFDDQFFELIPFPVYYQLFTLLSGEKVKACSSAKKLVRVSCT